MEREAENSWSWHRERELLSEKMKKKAQRGVSVEGTLAWCIGALIVEGEGQYGQRCSAPPPADPSGRSCHSP